MVTVWLTSKKNPKAWNVFDNAGRVLSETAVVQSFRIQLKKISPTSDE